jgi:hypothetical protein
MEAPAFPGPAFHPENLPLRPSTPTSNSRKRPAPSPAQSPFTSRPSTPSRVRQIAKLPRRQRAEDVRPVFVTANVDAWSLGSLERVKGAQYGLTVHGEDEMQRLDIEDSCIFSGGVQGRGVTVICVMGSTAGHLNAFLYAISSHKPQ